MSYLYRPPTGSIKYTPRIDWMSTPRSTSHAPQRPSAKTYDVNVVITAPDGAKSTLCKKLPDVGWDLCDIHNIISHVLTEAVKEAETVSLDSGSEEEEDTDTDSKCRE